jgi:hypothetical protein
MATTTSSSSSKSKGLSLHIGLNAVSPAAYGGWSGDLAACEFDAKDMAAIAKSRGMKSTVLLTKKEHAPRPWRPCARPPRHCGKAISFF